MPHPRRLPPPSPMLRAAVAIMAPVPTRQPWREAAAIIAMSLAAAITIIIVLGPAEGARARSLAVGAIVVLFAGRVVASAVPPRRAVLPQPRAPLTRTLLSAIGMAASMLVTHTGGTPAAPLTRGFLAAAWPCIACGLVAWLIPAAIATWALRHFLGNWRVALEISGAAAAISGMVLLVVCGRHDMAHVILVHGGVVLLAPLLGGIAAISLARRCLDAGRSIHCSQDRLK